MGPFRAHEGADVRIGLLCRATGAAAVVGNPAPATLGGMSGTVEEIRREFARAWGEIGAAWGVAPSTATVQGYLLAHGGPLTEPEVRRALGMSHRAASLALAQCEEWGLVERAEAPRRSGQRGPAAVAWVVVGDHWEWFRRVAAARRARETDPVLPVIERCVADARAAGAEAQDLEARLAGLLQFVQRFDRGVETFVRGEPSAIERLFLALDGLPADSVDRLWRLIGVLEPEELSGALTALAKLPPPAVRRLVAVADSAAMRKLLGLG
jgi:DNA-binding transcriptional regulator GbsR (MarR family)